MTPWPFQYKLWAEMYAIKGGYNSLYDPPPPHASMFNHETKLIGSTFSPMKKGVYAYMYETIQ
jgi:hypothetical protein